MDPVVHSVARVYGEAPEGVGGSSAWLSGLVLLDPCRPTEIALPHARGVA